jgi:hypothetical protein
MYDHGELFIAKVADSARDCALELDDRYGLLATVLLSDLLRGQA